MSFLGKKILAALRSSFTFRNSKTSCCGRLIQGCVGGRPAISPGFDLVAALP